jgi:hypothetical protein
MIPKFLRAWLHRRKVNDLEFRIAVLEQNAREDSAELRFLATTGAENIYLQFNHEQNLVELDQLRAELVKTRARAFA